MPGFVAQIHQDFFARVLKQMVVDHLPEDRVGEVPGNVDADGAISGPEVVVTQVVLRNEGYSLCAQFRTDLRQTLGQHILRLKLKIADAGGKQLLQPDLTFDRIVGHQPNNAALRLECRERH